MNIFESKWRELLEELLLCHNEHVKYDTTKGVEIFDVDFDISNDNEVYLRIVEDG